MRGIAFLGVTTVLFWLMVGIGVTRSLLDRAPREQWWEAEGSPYVEAERIGEIKPVVTGTDGHWRDL